MNRWRWIVQGLLAALAVEGMLLLAVLRGVLPGWQEPLTAVILITALAVTLYESVAGTTPTPSVEARSEDEESDAWLQFHLQETLRFAGWPKSAQERYLTFARSRVEKTWQPRCLLYEEEGCVAAAEPGSAFCRAHQPMAPDKAAPSSALVD
jgi:hypothetical protein